MKQTDQPAIKTCGDFGGRGLNGKPCGHRVYGERTRCGAHSLAGAKQLADAKARFLELYRTAAETLDSAAKKTGVDRANIWRWRQADAAFDRDVADIGRNLDDVRVEMVEESLFDRIVKGSASAAEVIFWLVNRSKGRWQHVQHVNMRHSGEIRAGVMVVPGMMESPGDWEVLARRQHASNGTPQANGQGENGHRNGAAG